MIYDLCFAEPPDAGLLKARSPRRERRGAGPEGKKKPPGVRAAFEESKPTASYGE